jgi:hypothetical protein
MLENGLITFDLIWALWKPNTLAFTTTYGSPDEPRVFKVDMAEKHVSIMKGEFYYIEGKVCAGGAPLAEGASTDQFLVLRVRRQAVRLRKHVRRD